MLTFDAQMNIMADAMATQQRDQMSKPITRILGDHVHLVIKDRYITRDSKMWLLQTSGEIPIQNYYKEKYRWTISVFNSIQWEIQHKALWSYRQSDQWRILKFTQDWLPTNYRLFREKQEASPACRLCGDLEETNDHMLKCLHFRQQQSQFKLHDYLWCDNENHGNSELNNIIKLALSESIYNKEWTPVMSAISNKLRPGIRQQNKIGWHHLYKGRIARAIIQFMEAHYRGLAIDAK
jgi:hypothetical protein